MIPLHPPEKHRAQELTETLEPVLARATGFAHGVLVNGPLFSLILALRALRLPPQTEVIVPALGSRGGEAALWAGLEAVPVPVDEEGCVTEAGVRGAITPRTRAVVAADTFGRQGPDLKALCLQRGIYLIEEGCLGLPNRKPNAFTLALGPRLGAVLTEDPEMAFRVRQGRGTDFAPSPFEMSQWAATLADLAARLELRRSQALWYRGALVPWELRGKLRLPQVPARPEAHVWEAFVVRVADPPGVKERLARAGIEAAVPLPGFLQLPLYPELTGKEMGLVVQRLPSCLDGPLTTSSSISR